MSYSIISLIVVLVQITTPISQELPKTWTKDFTISLSYTGSMDGSSTHLKYTYDSCIYITNSGMNSSKKSFFIMREADRIDILKKMRELKVNKIHSDVRIAPVDDGWSSLLCIGQHCIQGGTSAEMSDHDKDQFSIAYDYLESYAMKNATELK